MLKNYFDTYKLEGVAEVPAERAGSTADAVMSRIESERPIKMTAPRKRIRVAAIAAAVACAAALTVSVSAAGGFAEMMNGLFGTSPQAYELLRTDIFHDEDENVSIDVDEIITDGMCTYITLHYTALNDEGLEWIARGDVDEETRATMTEEESLECSYQRTIINDLINGKLRLYPYGSVIKDPTEDDYIRNTPIEMVASTSECEGSVNEDNGKNIRLMLELNQRDPEKKVRLEYPMSDGEVRKVSISTEGFIKEKTFVINAEPDDSKYYIPKSITFSQLSATLYGDYTEEAVAGCGQPIGERNGYTVYDCGLKVSTEEVANFVNNTYLVTKDGTRLYFVSCDTPKLEKSSTDKNTCVLLGSRYCAGGAVLYSMYGPDFKEEPGKNYRFTNFDRHEAVDPDDIIGIQIEDHYYSFTE